MNLGVTLSNWSHASSSRSGLSQHALLINISTFEIDREIETERQRDRKRARESAVDFGRVGQKCEIDNRD